MGSLKRGIWLVSPEAGCLLREGFLIVPCVRALLILVRGLQNGRGLVVCVVHDVFLAGDGQLHL